MAFISANNLNAHMMKKFNLLLLITLMSGVLIPAHSQTAAEVFGSLSTTSSNTYSTVSSVSVSDQYQTDRTYVIQSLPSALNDAELVKTANDDADETGTELFTIEVTYPSSIYIAYDSRSSSRPNWMSGYASTGTSIGTSDVTFDLYKKEVTPGELTFGGNKATGASGALSNYFVLGVSGVTVGSGIYNLINLDHGGYIDADPNNNLSLGSTDGSDRRWELIYDGDGAYLLECQTTGRRYLTENNGNIEWDNTSSTINDDDRWIVIPTDDHYKLKNVTSGHYLRVSNNSLEIGGNDTGDGALWQLNCATGTCADVPITGGAGVFNIESLSQGGYIDANPSNGVSLSTNDDGDDRRWELIHVGNGYYLIESKFGGRRYLTDRNGTPEWDDYGSSVSADELWELTISGVNYHFRNVGSGDYLKRTGDDLTMSGSSAGDDVVWKLNCTTDACTDPGDDSSDIAVTSVSLTPASVSIVDGATATLDVSVSPGNATDQTVTYASSNAGIASVNSSGVVTGVSPGTATITVRTNDGDFSDQTEVTVLRVGEGIFNLVNVGGNSVIDADPSGVSLGSGDGSDRRWELIHDGEGEYLLECQFSGRRYLTDNNGTVEWDGEGTSTTDNDRWEFEAVGPDFKIKNVNSGKYLRRSGSDVIVSTNTSGDDALWSLTCATGTCIKPGGGIPVSGVELTPTSTTVSLGATASLTVDITPAGASDQSVSFSSSNTSVATVNSEGVVTAVAAGSAVITVTTSDGGFTDTSNITVSGASGPGGSGVYNIVSLGGGTTIDANSNNQLVLGSGDGTDKRWQMIHDSNGKYFLECQFSGRRYLTDNSGAAEWDGDGTTTNDFDKWEFLAVGDDYKLRNVGSSKYLRRQDSTLTMSTNDSGNDALWTFNCATGACTDPGSGGVVQGQWIYLSGPEEENGDDIEILNNSGGDILVDCDGVRGHVAKNFTPVSLPAEITFNWRSTFDQNSSEPADGDLRGTGDFRISVVGVPSGESQEDLSEENLGDFEGVQFRIFPHLDESEEREHTYYSNGKRESHTATSIWVRYTDPDRLTGDDGAPHTGLQSDACQNRNRDDGTHNCGWDRHDIQGGGFDIEYNETMPMKIYISENLAYMEGNGRRFEIDPSDIRFDKLSAIVVGLTNTSRGYETFEITDLQAAYVGSSSRQVESIDEFAEKTGHQVYPVPTTKMLYVNDAEDVNKVEIYNTSGQLVLIQSNLADDRMAIAVEDLELGIYTVRIYLTNYQVETHRIMKR